MKKILAVVFITACFCMTSVQQSYAQTAELTQLVLDIEKLSELKKILKEMYQGYEILTKGYNTIRDISKGNFNMHQAFLDALLAVNPEIAKYKRVADIISEEAQIIKEYKENFSRFKRSKLFSTDELDYIEGSYEKVIDGSVKVLGELTMVITANKLRMSDDERIKAIDRLYGDIHVQWLFSHNLGNRITLLGAAEAQEKENIEALKILNGVN